MMCDLLFQVEKTEKLCVIFMGKTDPFFCGKRHGKADPSVFCEKFCHKKMGKFGERPATFRLKKAFFEVPKKSLLGM